MSDQLLDYYQRELRFIRKMAAEFAERHRPVANRLLITREGCDDPHVERLIEAFALLAARIHMRLDDDFPQLTDAMLGVLYPQLVSPVPPTAMVQFELDLEHGGADQGLLLPRHTLLRSIKQLDGVHCRFRTAYPVTLWPITIESAEFVTVNRRDYDHRSVQGVLRIVLRPAGGRKFAELPIRSLRFCLCGDSAVTHGLYAMLFRNPLGLELRPSETARGSHRSAILLEPHHLRPVGFGRDEGLVDDVPGSHPGYRLLLEFFTFPEKFLFFDVSGLDRNVPALGGDALELRILLADAVDPWLARALRTDHLRLGCTPAVNLFPHPAEPILLPDTKSEHVVDPQGTLPHAYEVHTIKRVITRSDDGQATTFRPFYALRHGASGGEEAAFWHAERRPSLRKGDSGTDVSLMLVDHNFQPAKRIPSTAVLVDTLCTNRDLPSRLDPNQPHGDFRMEGGVGVRKISCLARPTASVRPSLKNRARWKLVSHLCLSHLAIADADHAGEVAGGSDEQKPSPSLWALREVLKLYDLTDSAAMLKRIEGVVSLSSRRVLRPVVSDRQVTHAWGVEITITFDEDHYAESSVFLFASVLERFFAFSVAINSFTQTVARVRQREGELKRWPPRAGEIALL